MMIWNGQSKNFKIDEAADILRPCLVLAGPWRPVYAELMRERDIPALRLSQSLGWQPEDLGFLQAIAGHLRGLEIYHWGVRDLGPVSVCRKLEFLGLQCESRRAPDLSRLPLRVLFANWTPALSSVFDCGGLKHLNMVNYPDEHLGRLSRMSG